MTILTTSKLNLLVKLCRNDILIIEIGSIKFYGKKIRLNLELNTIKKKEMDNEKKSCAKTISLRVLLFFLTFDC